MICKSITKTFFMLCYFIKEKILLFLFINQEIFFTFAPTIHGGCSSAG
jgi:hypothetical protein